MNERPITIVFIAPTRNRNPFCFCCMSSEPMTAAWPEPMPGRNEESGAANIAARVARRVSFFESIIFFRGCIFWLGIVVLFLIEMPNAESPKRPVSKGNSGSFTGRLKVRIPKNPDSEKTVKEIRNSSSLKIRKNEMNISKYGIKVCIKSRSDGRNFMKIGVKMRIVGSAIKEP